MAAGDSLFRAAKQYNEMLDLHIQANNARHPQASDVLHVFDLGNLIEYRNLIALHGFGEVILINFPLRGEKPYYHDHKVENDVDEFLSDGKKSTLYIPIHSRIKDDPLNEVSRVVDSKRVQMGYAVTRGNISVGEGVEFHPRGYEILAPELGFDLVALLTGSKLDKDQRTLDASNTILVRVPANNDQALQLSPSIGHWYPSLTGVARVYLPSGTGGKLTEKEAKSKLYVAHNISFAAPGGKFEGKPVARIIEPPNPGLQKFLEEFNGTVEQKIGGLLEKLRTT